jgi:outer membrane protein
MSLFPTASFSTPNGVQLGRSINPITNTYTNSSLVYQDYSLTSSFALAGWGKLRDAAKAQRFTWDAAKTTGEKTWDDVIVSVINDYLQALMSKEQIRISRLQLALTKKQVELGKVRYAGEKLSALDLAQLTAQLASDSVDELTQEQAYADNIIALQTVLNISQTQDFEVEDISFDALHPALIDESPETIYQSALHKLPQPKVDEFKVKAAELTARSAKKAMYPSLSMDYTAYTYFSNYIAHVPLKAWWTQYGHQLNGDFYQQISLSLNIPIFNSGRLRTAYQQSKLDEQNAELQLQQDNLQLRQTIYTLYADIQSSFRKADEGESLVGESKKQYELTLEAFNFGTKDVFALLTSENTLQKARERQLSSRYEYIFKSQLLTFYENGRLK